MANGVECTVPIQSLCLPTLILFQSVLFGVFCFFREILLIGISIAFIFVADIGRGVMDRPPESPTS